MVPDMLNNTSGGAGSGGGAGVGAGSGGGALLVELPPPPPPPQAVASKVMARLAIRLGDNSRMVAAPLHFQNNFAHVLSALHVCVGLLHLLQGEYTIHDWPDRATFEVGINMLEDFLDHNGLLGKSLGAQC